MLHARLAITFSLIILTSCVSSPTRFDAPGSSLPNVASFASGTDARAIDPQSLALSLRPSGLPNDRALAALLPAPPRPYSSVLPGGGKEIAGVRFNGGGPYSSVFAQQTAYLPSQLHLTYPPTGPRTGNEVLFGPTLQGTNGDCLETSVIYSSSSTAPTRAVLGVINHCAGGRYDVATPIDAAFAGKYIRSSVYGPAIGIEMYTLNVPITSSSKWFAIIYNYTRGAYDTLDSAVGKTATPGGWDMFETQYVTGQCPKSLPIISSNRVTMYNTVTRNFDMVKPVMSGSTTTALNGASYDCFKTTSSGSASYKFSMISPNYFWEVTSTGH